MSVSMEATVFIILFLTHGKQLENGLVFEIQYMYIFVFKISKIGWMTQLSFLLSVYTKPVYKYFFDSHFYLFVYN